MVEKSEQREQNRHQLHGFLQSIRIYEIDSETADLYGRIKAAILDRFGPREKAKRRGATTAKPGVTENDSQNAAIAQRFNLMVVAADKDFQRIQEASSALSLETRWHPETPPDGS